MIANHTFLKSLGVVTVFSTVLFTSCTKVDAGSGDTIEKRIEVSDFNKISFELGGELLYTQGTNTQVQVNATENALTGIDVFVKNETLYIKRKKGYSIINQDNLEFIVTDDDTYEIYTCGSGNVTADFDESYQFDTHLLKSSGSGNINADYINANEQKALTSGSGNISIDYISTPYAIAKTNGSGDVIYGQLDAPFAELKSNGSGDIYLNKGTIETADIDLHGSGNYNGYQTYIHEANFLGCGSGVGYIRASNNLIISLSGSGDLFYKGYPTIEQSVSGSGNVIDAN